jgi:hypothetical protein
VRFGPSSVALAFWLAREATAETRTALAWLGSGRAEGAFDDLAGYFAWSDDRYGAHLSGSVCQVGGVRFRDDVCFPLGMTGC